MSMEKDSSTRYEKFVTVVSHFLWKKKFTPQTIYHKFGNMYDESVNREYFKKYEKYYHVYQDDQFNTRLYKLKKRYLLLHWFEIISKIIIALPAIVIISSEDLFKIIKREIKSNSDYRRIK